jgi:exonuclease SbcC
LDDKRKKLTNEQISLGNPEAKRTEVQSEVKAFEQYQKDLSKLSFNRKQLTTEQNTFKTLNEQATDAENEWCRMTNLFYSAQAGILAERLEEGKPCPVCGSTRHPIKAQKAQDVPSEEELKHLDFKAKELRNKANEQSNKCSGLIKTIGDEEERFTKLGWSTDEAELATLPIRIVKLENQINELSAKVSRFKLIPGLIEQLGTQRQHLEKEKDAITEEETKAKNDIDTANEQITKLKERCAYADENAARKAITDLRKEANDLQKNINDTKEQFDNILNEIKRVKDKIKTHEDNLKNVVTLNKDDESEKLQKAQTTFDAITPSINTIVGRENNNRNALKQLQLKATQLEQIEKRYQWLKPLNDTVLGQLSGKEKIMLETYILSTYFERIIRKANLRLLKMTNNQYELRRKQDAVNNRQQTGLDLDIVDHHNGKIRTVKSLSGGESFMASLSLALGLSDEIQSSCGGIHLNTMFVDEGFGSLDEESRILARNTLQKLSQEGNRLIGVISHVPELKAIERQIQVHKDHNGVSTAEVVLL